MKKVAMYCRVSSDDQKNRDTIENQIETLNAYIEFKEDLEKYDEYLDDAISGTVPFDQRPKGKQLIEDCKKGLFQAILVYKVDRFGRDTLSGLSAVELLRNYNIEIISVTEPFDLNTPTGRFQFISYLNMAELDRNNILERMFIGATRAAKQGKWLGGIVPYGYFVNKEKFLEINEIEATIVRKIFDLYINDGLSILDVTCYLNNSGIDCNYAIRGTGKKNYDSKLSIWSTATIQRIFSSTTYIGIHEYGKRSTKRKETIVRQVPAIIPVEIFEEAQIKKSENKIMSSRNSPNRDFLLRTLIKCGECGRTYYGIYYKKSKSVYSCSGKKNAAKKLYGVKCSNINVVADTIENYAWECCKYILLNFKDFKVKVEDNNIFNEIQEEIERLNKIIGNFENEKSNVFKLYRKNLIDDLELEGQLTDIKKENKKYQKLLQEALNKLEVYNDKNTILNEFEKTVDYYKNRLGVISDEDKKVIFKFLIKEIIITTNIDDGIKTEAFDISWNLPDLIFAPTSLQKLSQNSSELRSEKIPTLYIDKNLYIYIGKKLTNLRLTKNLTRKDLSKEMNLSEYTLKGLELGLIKKSFHYIHLYCRHFNASPYNYLNFDKIIIKTFEEKLTYLMLYYGCKRKVDLDKILNKYDGYISDSINKNANRDFLTTINNKIKEIKK